jgi:D-cysteine desulfhydrase family pyridoxal phosphate-dependent enzyme
MNDKSLELQRKNTIETISAQIPRHSLAHYPTPLRPAQQLSEYLSGPELWFKRDDLISFGFGGNKIRGLEVMLADALAKGADTLITGAGVQSNHVRATAATAAYAGLRCIAVYWGSPPAQADGNYRLAKLLNAEFRFTKSDDRASVDTVINAVAAEQRKNGAQPYPIPRGGACAMGVLGHVLAVFELYQQCLLQSVEPDAIVLPVGSGGTYAGWMIGTKLLNLPWKLECFSVSREPEEVSRQVAQLATEAAELLHLGWRLSAADVPVHGGFIGAGYGIPSSQGAEAIKCVSRKEGVLLDPTYTGKAMAGLMHGIRQGRFDQYERVIYLHTGGEPAFFAGDGLWLND